MQRKMIKIQLQIKLKRNVNNITSNHTIYDIKELRINPKKRKEDIGKFIKGNNINTNNWNIITNEIITILKNNYPNKTKDKTKGGK